MRRNHLVIYGVHLAKPSLLPKVVPPLYTPLGFLVLLCDARCFGDGCISVFSRMKFFLDGSSARGNLPSHGSSTLLNAARGDALRSELRRPGGDRKTLFGVHYGLLTEDGFAGSKVRHKALYHCFDRMAGQLPSMLIWKS